MIETREQLHKQLKNATLQQKLQIAYNIRYNKKLNITHKQALNCVKALVQQIRAVQPKSVEQKTKQFFYK
tara:strand:- start:468 stop:677 length:210 start_codon:yes stop_codon:yes gene_type:complete